MLLFAFRHGFWIRDSSYWRRSHKDCGYVLMLIQRALVTDPDRQILDDVDKGTL
jgi:hypothetical protein